MGFITFASRMFKYLLLFIVLFSPSWANPIDEPSSAKLENRWGNYGFGGTTGIVAGGVLPLPCDCLSKCYGSAVYTSATSCSCFLFWSTTCGQFQATFGGQYRTNIMVQNKFKTKFMT